MNEHDYAAELFVVAKLKHNTFEYELFTDIADAITQFTIWAREIGVNEIDWDNPTFTVHDDGFALAQRKGIVVMIEIDADRALKTLQLSDNE